AVRGRRRRPLVRHLRRRRARRRRPAPRARPRRRRARHRGRQRAPGARGAAAGARGRRGGRRRRAGPGVGRAADGGRHARRPAGGAARRGRARPPGAARRRGRRHDPHPRAPPAPPLGARVRTLPAAVAPVLAGTGAAAAVDGAHGVRALLAAGVALALQVGVNLANDYSDGIRGTDDHRVGPTRLTASGAVPPATVRRAAFAAFGVAAVLGLALCAAAGTWWLLAVGALCVVAAWYYTGGRNPYGYRGLGEVAVFVFFGLVATVGT